MLKSRGVKIRSNETVQKIEKHSDTSMVCLVKIATGAVIKRHANVVIIGTTLGSMRKIRGLRDILPTPVYQAMTTLNTEDSTKCFALVNVVNIPEVNNIEFPKVIIADQGSHQIYILDANSPQKKLILFFYAWAGDSTAARSKTAKQIYDMAKSTAKQATTGSGYQKSILKMLNQVEGDLAMKRWADDEHACNGFAMPLPDQNKMIETMTHHWIEALHNKKNGGYLYLSGDFFGLTAGWIEGSLMNAATIASSELQAHGKCYSPQIAPCNVFQKTFIY